MNTLTKAFSDRPEIGALQLVADGVWWLKMPLPFELDHINLYLLEAPDGWTIVDTGLGGKNTHAIWQTLFEGPLSSKPLLQVIVTHFHPDHVGAAGWLCERYQVPLLISEKEYNASRQMMAANDDLSVQFRYLASLGLDEELAAPVIKATNSLIHVYDPLPEHFQPLQQGQVITVGGREWQVSLADGHSPAHATLFCESLNVLISGDQVLPRISSNVSVRMDEPQANPLQCWLSGLDQLYQLPEQVLVLPAHDEPFFGLHPRLTALKEEHKQLLDKLLSLCGSKGQTVYQLSHQLYNRPLSNFTLLMALGECQAHLHYLLAAGAIEQCQREDGALLFLRKNI